MISDIESSGSPGMLELWPISDADKSDVSTLPDPSVLGVCVRIVSECVGIVLVSVSIAALR